MPRTSRFPGRRTAASATTGRQPGDGQPSGDPAAVRQQIRDTTQAVLQLDRPAPAGATEAEAAQPPKKK